MAEARNQGRASPRLEEACHSSMLTLEADEGARLREEGDRGGGVSSMPSRGVQWRKGSRAAVHLEESPPASFHQGDGDVIRTVTPSQFVALRASLSQGTPKCNSILTGGFNFF